MTDLIKMGAAFVAGWVTGKHLWPAVVTWVKAKTGI